MGKYICFFGGKKREIPFCLSDLGKIFGNKGANLIHMWLAEISVPPGFVLSTELCRYFYTNFSYPDDFYSELEENIKLLEETTGCSFGSKKKPLLVSVRSGAPVSMPGMMDTILNLGMNDIIASSLEELTQDKRFAYNTYRRFIAMFSSIIYKEIKAKDLEELLEDFKRKEGKVQDIDLTGEDWERVVQIYKDFLKEKNIELPQDPWEQLDLAIKAVFNSWNNPRAITYRTIYKIPHSLGTGVIVQKMVFGNISSDSLTGVGFTRHPSTGEKIPYGEYLPVAQGEDVVAGIRTPQPISRLRTEFPQIYEELISVYRALEEYYKDMQDVEFTAERGKLYMLQTRTAKRTPQAALRCAVDMVKEGLINKEEAILRITPEQLDMLLHLQFDPEKKKKAIGTGLPASPGAAVGQVVFTSKDAEEWAALGKSVILVRPETSPEDIRGMVAAVGILTARGGMTSHAAVVARGMGKCCIAGCEAMKLREKEFILEGKVIKEGDFISLDGSTGEVMEGKVDLIESEILQVIKGKKKKEEADLYLAFEELLSWLDEMSEMKVRANAEQPEDVRLARKLGASGIGLCRTEHMFFAKDRLPLMQKMILAETTESREKALSQLLPYQKGDFEEIFRIMEGLPVTIRLLDPPLHEFLPSWQELFIRIKELEAKPKKTKEEEEELKDKERLLRRVEELKEVNPMLGLRGCRLSIYYPEIIKMQTRAIFEAACKLAKEKISVFPEIMVPLVSEVKELKWQKNIIEEIAKNVFDEYGITVPYTIGTMIEVPRAALTAAEIAEEADFFSFGTNDLTQTTFGFSRDDAEGKFLDHYLQHEIIEENPFSVLDEKGVGCLLEIGVKSGRSTKKDLKIGICGEHGGDPKSIRFCYKIGLDYVSCSPYRIPIAKLEAARASLSQKKSS